jgi:hypothetical protein
MNSLYQQPRPLKSSAATLVYTIIHQYSFSAKPYLPKAHRHIINENKQKYNKNMAIRKSPSMPLFTPTKS